MGAERDCMVEQFLVCTFLKYLEIIWTQLPLIDHSKNSKVFFGYFNLKILKSYCPFNLKSKLQLTLSVKKQTYNLLNVMLMKYVLKNQFKKTWVVMMKTDPAHLDGTTF